MQDEPDPIPHLQHKLLNAALALIVIYAQLTTIFVMSSETPESKSQMQTGTLMKQMSWFNTSGTIRQRLVMEAISSHKH